VAKAPRVKIIIITTAPPGSHRGARVNAERWVRRMSELGHEAAIAHEWRGDADLVIYQDPADASAHGADVPWRIVVTDESAAAQVPAALRGRTRVIRPSAEPVAPVHPPDPDVFQICVLAHLRESCDPLRTAQAARLLPLESRIQIVHAGAAIGREMREEAQLEEGKNLRYRWVGDLPRSEALRLLARSRVLVVAARKGGTNATAEALAAGVPVVATPRALTLGESYPGHFAPGDTHALATLMYRAETDAAFYQALVGGCERARAIAEPAREREAWAELLSP